jgi:hypothetical protein
VVIPSKDDDEFRKHILCALMDGVRLGWLDEVGALFGGARFNGLVTATVYKDRILGESRTWSGPHYTTWVATGNNVGLTTDTPRRCVYIRLEPQDEHPEMRSGFKIDNLVAYAKAHQAELLGHVLTILRAFHVAGRPQAKLTPFGAFETWASPAHYPEVSLSKAK